MNFLLLKKVKITIKDEEKVKELKMSSTFSADAIKMMLPE